jgi:hypothetical protein
MSHSPSDDQDDQDDQDDMLALQAFLAQFLDHRSNGTDKAMRKTLRKICAILKSSPFCELNWKALLYSGLFSFLATELSPLSSIKLLSAQLSCFASLLRYPPWNHIMQSDPGLHEDVYVQSVVAYASWIPDEFVGHYFHVLARSVAIFCPEIGHVCDLLASVYHRVFDPETATAELHDLGDALLPILTNRGSPPDLLAEVVIRLGVFVELVISNGFQTEQSDQVVLYVLMGMQHIAAFFPSACLEFYTLDICTIDDLLYERGVLYSTFRDLFLQSIKSMAEYWPLHLNWSVPCIQHFCADDEADFGVPGLEIMALLFSARSRLFPPSVYPGLCDWFLCEMESCVFARLEALVRCFANFLISSDPALPPETYQNMFLYVAPLLDPCLSDGCLCEIVAVSLRLLAWFVNKGFANSDALSELASLQILRKGLHQLSDDDDSVIFKVQIAGAMETIEAYLAQEYARNAWGFGQNAWGFNQKAPESNQNPRESGAESPRRSFSDDDFSIYYTRPEVCLLDDLEGPNDEGPDLEMLWDAKFVRRPLPLPTALADDFDQ